MITDAILAKIKTQLLADDIGDPAEAAKLDAKLGDYYEAAELLLSAECGRTPEEMLELGGGSYPADYERALIMLVGHQLDQLEAFTPQRYGADPFFVAIVKKYEILSRR